MDGHLPKYDVFQAIADPTRRKLLRLLAHRDMPINAITEEFPISRTAVNKHLHVLSHAGLVSSQKVGRNTVYRLHPEPLVELKQWLAFYEQFWDNKMAMLRYYVEHDNEHEKDQDIDQDNDTDQDNDQDSTDDDEGTNEADSINYEDRPDDTDDTE